MERTGEMIGGLVAIVIVMAFGFGAFFLGASRAPTNVDTINYYLTAKQTTEEKKKKAADDKKDSEEAAKSFDASYDSVEDALAGRKRATKRDE